MRYPFSQLSPIAVICLDQQGKHEGGPAYRPSSFSSASVGEQANSPRLGRPDLQDILERLFEPQILISCQFFEKSYRLSGESRLLLAILMDAINCYLSGDNVESKQAIYWFTNSYQNEKKSFTSFHFICEVFNIDPHRLWRSLRSLKSQKTHPTSRISGRMRYFKKWRKIAL